VLLAYSNPQRRFLTSSVDFSWFGEDDPALQGSLPRLREGGVDVVVLSYSVPIEPLQPVGSGRGARAAPAWGPVFQGAEQVKYVLHCLDSLIRTIEAHADEAEVALTVRDVERINQAGKMAIILHLTGAWIDGDLSILRTYHRLGVRSIHIAREGQRGIADPSDDFAEAGGLTPLGRDVVREMNRLHMVVDVAHASDRSFWDILETSSQPVIASHHNARALCDINRNLSDEQLRAVAQQGGVVGAHFSGGFIDEAWRQSREDSGYFDIYLARAKELRQRYPNPYEFLSHFQHPSEWPESFGEKPKPKVPLPGISQLVDHIDHVVEVAGIDHVGNGADYDLGDIPEELDHAGKLLNLTAELLRRGYSDADIRKIWGDNFLRVFRRVIDG
jgi:membrane dipeptidase